MKSLLKAANISVLALMLTGCAWPIWMKGTDDSGSTLSAGNAVKLDFFTNDASFDTGVRLREGGQYALNIKILSNWVDSRIEDNEHGESLDETGFADSLQSRTRASWTKRSGGNRWFELMLFQENCPRASKRGVTDLNFDEASGSYNFVATCDGKLTLFVNDSHGFYSSNVGYANIDLVRVN